MEPSRGCGGSKVLKRGYTRVLADQLFIKRCRARPVRIKASAVVIPPNVDGDGRPCGMPGDGEQFTVALLAVSSVQPPL